MNRAVLICLWLVILPFAQTVFGQADSNTDFKIHLLADDIRPDQLAALDIKRLKPAGEPVISLRDILTYLKDRHEIRLNGAGANRLRKLQVPASGKPFIAFAGDEPIYAGAFFKQYSSHNFDGFAVDITNLAGDFPTVKIAAKYPEVSPKIRFEDERQTDARSDERIMKSLERAGVLFEELQLLGRCKSIVSTGTRLESYRVTFAVTRIHKGVYAGPEITFLVKLDLMRRLFEALEAKGPGWGSDWKFDAETEFFLKFERQVGGENPPAVLKGFTKLTLAEREKPKMPAPSEIARVEFEPGFAVWSGEKELLERLPRFVASEGAYVTRPFQVGSFVLRNGKILRWWSADKNSILLFDDLPYKTRRRLFVLPEEERQDEDEDLFVIWDWGGADGPAVSTNNPPKKGFINAAGDIVIAPRFDDVGNFSEGLAAARVGKLWGYVDRAGRIVIGPLWKEAYSFSDGVAAVNDTNSIYSRSDSDYSVTIKSCGYVDRRGQYVIRPGFMEGLTNCPTFYKGLAEVCFPWDVRNFSPDFPFLGKCGLIDKTGRWAVEPKPAGERLVPEERVQEITDEIKRRERLRKRLKLELLALWTIGNMRANVHGYRNEQGKYVWVSPGAWRLGAKWWRENYVGKQPTPNFPRQ